MKQHDTLAFSITLLLYLLAAIALYMLTKSTTPHRKTLHTIPITLHTFAFQGQTPVAPKPLERLPEMHKETTPKLVQKLVKQPQQTKIHTPIALKKPKPRIIKKKHIPKRRIVKKVRKKRALSTRNIAPQKPVKHKKTQRHIPKKSKQHKSVVRQKHQYVKRAKERRKPSPKKGRIATVAQASPKVDAAQKQRFLQVLRRRIEAHLSLIHI